MCRRYCLLIAYTLYTTEANGHVSQEKLAEAFDRLDSDNTGFITKANLKELMGSDYDDKEATEMIASADIKVLSIDSL
jgi:Ca2+-binding EF-hand superfamily protein